MVTTIIKIIKRINPAPFKRPCHFSEILFPEIHSIKTNKILPPSKAGNGKILKIAKDIESTAENNKR